MSGHVGIVELLLKDKRINPNQGQGGVGYESMDGFTPLICAFINNRVEVVKLLLRDPRVKIVKIDKNSFDYLTRCCFDGYYELAELVLTDPRFDKTDKSLIYDSYLSAYIHGNNEILKLLILLIDDYVFKIPDDYDADDETVINTIKTFKGSYEYHLMRCKYLKDYSAGLIFHSVVMLSDNYLKICDC